MNVSGYRFVELDDLSDLQASLTFRLTASGSRGTVLIAAEGINVSLAGTRQQIDDARAALDEDARFQGMWLKQSFSDCVPFARLKVRVRREIIAFEGDDAPLRTPALTRARRDSPGVDPATLRQWLDDGRDITLLDTRNAYEVASGTFRKAQDLGIDNFRDFTAAVEAAVEAGTLDPTQPLVTFCTGGIRCEKAAPWLLANGFSKVWQIEGGILNWFAHCGSEHWQGDCFVFDDRVEIDADLAPTGASLCPDCHRAVPRDVECECQASRSAIDTV